MGIFLLIMLCIFIVGLVTISLVCIGKIAWRWTLDYCKLHGWIDDKYNW